MKSILLLLCLSVISLNVAFGQSSDSLKQVLEQPDLSEKDELNTLMALGIVLSWPSPKEAAEYLFRALDLSVRLKSTKHTSKASLKLGEILQTQGQYQQATVFLINADSLYQSINDIEGVIRTKHAIGELFMDIGNIKKGMMFFENALKISLEHNKMNYVARSYSNLGTGYQMMGDDEKAAVYYKKCYELLNKNVYDEIDTKMALATLHGNMAVTLYNQKRMKEALEFNKRSSVLYKEIDLQRNLTIVYYNSAEIFLKMNMPDSAIYWANQSLLLASEHKVIDSKMNAYLRLAEAYSQKNNSKLALVNYRKYVDIKDSIYDQRELGHIQQLHEGYQLGKKEEEINSLKSQQEKLALDLKLNQSYTLLAIVVACFLLIILSMTAYVYFRKRNLVNALDNKNKEISRLNTALEIRILRSNMDPHFVFNALNGLQHFISSHNVEQSISYLNKVAKLIRITLQNSSRDWAMLCEEIEILKLYLHIEQYRFPNKFSFEFIVDEGLEHEEIPFLVIQPYVENAVIHGLLPKEGTHGKLIIKAEKSDGKMIIVIEDNGVGRGVINPQKSALFSSMGSNLVRKRLAHLSLQLGLLMESHTEDLKDAQGKPIGTRNILLFEMKSKFKSLAA